MTTTGAFHLAGNVPGMNPQDWTTAAYATGIVTVSALLFAAVALSEALRRRRSRNHHPARRTAHRGSDSR